MPRLICPMRCVSLVALFLAVGALSGCGRSQGSVSGKVTYMNKALKGGIVGFVSTEGLPSVTGTINEDGSFAIDKIPAGNYQVFVDTESLKPPQGSTPKGPGSGTSTGGVDPKTSGPPPGAELPEGYKPINPNEAEATLKANAKKYVAIPPNYATSEKSGLSFTVVAGAQTYNIELK